MMTTSEQYATVLRQPRIEPITSMLGRLSAGPASSSASAGPGPMPLPSSPWTIGTSVSVAKYMNAPSNAAQKLAASELPPTAQATQALGINPSLPGRPSSSPLTSTP